ncbi:uncharacterized protein LTHEOB_5618 [Lasiodiplodia theobromae]|uniref:uncharacterized protein n=1 Tax=Lasiodiplodia theobromae TaxID=45133 RepID=UPI0015C3F241|nr:uncharacterized protein LTHEOB_5618 [Lasiodiplodia theobromae]KAF4545207.1 hypothetical protein LTHEOB_5618 [Lasiodiplodia theobromae]
MTTMGDLSVPNMRGKSFAERLSASRKTSAELVQEANILSTQGDASGIIANRIKQCVELDTEHTILLEEQEDNFRKRRISRKEFDEECLKMQVKGRTVSWKRFLSDRYTGTIWTLEFNPEEHLDGAKPLEMFWCPILQEWFDDFKVVGAHIIPRAKRNEYVKLLFGVGNAHDFITSARNGIIMHKWLAEDFQMGYFVIVPDSEYDEHERPEYKIQVIKHDLLANKGGKRTVAACWWMGDEFQRVCWDDLDGKKLEFPSQCDIRPSRRCLFQHMITAVMSAKAKNYRGWEETMNSILEKEFWTSPGEYLNRALLESIWKLATGTGVPEKMLRHTFEDAEVRDTRSATLEWRVASEDRQFVSREDDGDSDDEDDDNDDDDYDEYVAW